MANKDDMCPNCGKEIDHWLNREVCGNQVEYDFVCLNCKFEGKQIYKMVFYGFTDSEGKAVIK